LFFWQFGEFKNKKISQNAVYSKKCISLNPNHATVICAQLEKECEYHNLTNELRLSTIASTQKNRTIFKIQNISYHLKNP